MIYKYIPVAVDFLVSTAVGQQFLEDMSSPCPASELEIRQARCIDVLRRYPGFNRCMFSEDVEGIAKHVPVWSRVIENNFSQVLEFLLTSGQLNPFVQDEDGNSPSVMALIHNCPECLNLLLPYVDLDGRPHLLIDACEYGASDCLPLLRFEDIYEEVSVKRMIPMDHRPMAYLEGQDTEYPWPVARLMAFFVLSEDEDRDSRHFYTMVKTAYLTWPEQQENLSLALVDALGLVYRFREEGQDSFADFECLIEDEALWSGVVQQIVKSPDVSGLYDLVFRAMPHWIAMDFETFSTHFLSLFTPDALRQLGVEASLSLCDAFGSALDAFEGDDDVDALCADRGLRQFVLQHEGQVDDEIYPHFSRVVARVRALLPAPRLAHQLDEQSDGSDSEDGPNKRRKIQSDSENEEADFRVPNC